MELLDAHCHLDLMADGPACAAGLGAAGVRVWNMTVDPQQFELAKLRYSGNERIETGLGLHPWYQPQLDRFEELLPQVRIVGEVGLDFGGRSQVEREVQVAAFTRLAGLCAHSGGKLLSIHAVRACGTVLDILEASGCLESCQVVFHWFSGSCDELQRALAFGCSFSVGERMLATKRGRAYVQAIPCERLFLETDLPLSGGDAVDAAAIARSLKAASSALEALRA